MLLKEYMSLVELVSSSSGITVVLDIASYNYKIVSAHMN